MTDDVKLEPRLRPSGNSPWRDMDELKEAFPDSGNVIGWLEKSHRGSQLALIKLKDGKPFIVNDNFYFDLPKVIKWRYELEGPEEFSTD